MLSLCSLGIYVCTMGIPNVGGMGVLYAVPERRPEKN